MLKPLATALGKSGGGDARTIEKMMLTARRGGPVTPMMSGALL
jgi:hypothetical protein